MANATSTAGTAGDYTDVTELAGDEVAPEQVERVARRYAWALPYCAGKDVLEAACGTGPGLGLVARRANSLAAGDISDAMVQRVRAHYGSRVRVERMDAQSLPFADGSLDIVILFEALYYLPQAGRFAAECARVLRPGGTVLVSNANKDLYDFNPSPHSHVYHGVRELGELFAGAGLKCAFWGDTPLATLSLRQRILRPIKKAVVGLGLMPKSMAGKKLLKRLVFGGMVAFPSELTEDMLLPPSPTPLEPGVADRSHKVIFCAARKD